MADSQLSDLKYSIHKYSSYSTVYIPQNILEDKPHDQTSRWSSDSNEFPQYLILQLERPAIVKKITFGKYEKNHVCNIKKFCIYGGLTDENMVMLLESGLKNNTLREHFNLRHSVGNNSFPIRYIKIMPLQCWTSTFNFSIWFIALHGCEDWNVVQKCINWYAVYRERESIRLCLKHFRQHNYYEAFESLSKNSNVHLEDPFLTELHDCIVKQGNFEYSEKLMEKAANDGYFEQYVSQLNYKPKWTAIIPCTALTTKNRPGMRGGHQMCIDTNNQIIYLFGGWDGTQDLSDLWSYNIVTEEWQCISGDTQIEGGPTGRSCHKMCLDPKRKQLFTLGKYLDSSLRHKDNLKSDFYMYDIESNKWTMITEDTSAISGPQLVFDHQMVMDIDNRIIYVFGGRVLTPSRWEGCASGLSLDESSSRNSNGSTYTPHDPVFSGLYSYHVATSTWTKLREDASAHSATRIKSRIGHSMLFHSGTHQLFILAGQRHKEFLTDFFTYNIDSDTITHISDGNQKNPNSVPSAGFTQKATIDPILNEIHVLAGLSKDKDKRDDNVRNSFWVYNISLNKWSCIYHNEQMDETQWNKMQHSEPCPRFAHQLVYNEVRKIHYLFGGNPGKQSLPKMRLDDFWSLHLSRPTADQLLKTCLFLIRKNKFKELAQIDPMSALTYLQTTLHNAVDHHNSEQVKELQSLTPDLFQNPDPTSVFIATPKLHLNKHFLSHSEPVAGPSGASSESRPLDSLKDFCTDIFKNPCLSSMNSPSSTMSEDSQERVEQNPNIKPLTRFSKDQLEAWQHLTRSQLFDELTGFFPESMTQPRSNLVDLVPL